MEAKPLRILDRSSDFVVLAVRMMGGMPGEINLMEKAGFYGGTEHSVLLYIPHLEETFLNPIEWANDRLTNLHRYLILAWHRLASAQTIDMADVDKHFSHDS